MYSYVNYKYCIIAHLRRERRCSQYRQVLFIVHSKCMAIEFTKGTNFSTEYFMSQNMSKTQYIMLNKYPWGHVECYDYMNTMEYQMLAKIK